ncbi:MAG TPA: F0F1 ATP synthase subunit A, partial [Phenylobacterium sp.]|nr:F0F1 ATP synthase subunit A [Phenylobacterium sp.]
MSNQPAIQPMEQFMVHKIVDLPVVHIGGMALDLSITNSVASMIAGAILLVLFFALTARREIVPNRGQALAESLYNIIDRVLVGPILGPDGRPYVPYLFTLFMVILTLN